MINNVITFPNTGSIETELAHANIDALYGPYNSKLEAYESLYDAEYGDYDYVTPGLTVGIWEEGKIVEYQWKKQPELGLRLTVNDLERKEDAYGLTISSVTYTKDEINNKITFRVRVTGSGLGPTTSIYLDSRLLISDLTSLNQELELVVDAPTLPGNYTYKIRAHSLMGGEDPIQDVVLTWKKVQVDILEDSSDITRYTVKSYDALKNSNFSFRISKINEFTILHLYVIYGSKNNPYTQQDPLASRHSLELSYNTNTDVYNVDMSLLTELASGDLVLVEVVGKEGNLSSETIYKEIVLLTAPNVYNVTKFELPLFAFNNKSFTATVRFEAEKLLAYPVTIKDGNTIIYSGILNSYTDNSILIKVEDNNLTGATTHTLRIEINGTYVTEKGIQLEPFYSTVFLGKINNSGNYQQSIYYPYDDNETTYIASYILDLPCYIPYNTDSNKPYSFRFADIKINNDYIEFGSIKYPTPLLLDIELGFMRNVCSPDPNNTNNSYNYDALFVNGILCAKSPITQNNIPSVVLNWSKSQNSTITDIISKQTEDNKLVFYYDVNPIRLEVTSSENDSFVLETNFKARNASLSVEPSSYPIFRISTPIDKYLTTADLIYYKLTGDTTSGIYDNSLVNTSLNDIEAETLVTFNNITYNIIQNKFLRIGRFGNLGEPKYTVEQEGGVVTGLSDLYSSMYDICRLYAEAKGIANVYENSFKSMTKAVKQLGAFIIPDTYLTLTKQSVDAKKLLLKYVAVPGDWTYTDSIGGVTSGQLLAFTQGTSTLKYSLPNFTFKFFQNNTLFANSAIVRIVPKINRTLNNIIGEAVLDANNQLDYYVETELVAKADYMESSHLNNTPTAMFYNAITTSTNGLGPNNILKNPNTDGKLNAIEGIPIILIIEDKNYGSFMLNIGKTGNSIGFGSAGISLEGTSNDLTIGRSCRFDFAEKDNEVQTIINNIVDVDALTELDIRKSNGKLQDDHQKIVDFLAEGLEYRYSGAGASDIGDNIEEYKKILKMWKWVNASSYNDVAEFNMMFDFEYTALYYIQMMIFGQTDNLGKNTMFDYFEFTDEHDNVIGKWYPRPYDMDSQAGLNNNGYDKIPPIVEISSAFTLDEATKDQRYVRYLGENVNRYPYSSTGSRFWNIFYNKLKVNISNFYKLLRSLGYNYDTIITLCQDIVINKLGTKLYNVDFVNKYLPNENSLQQFAYGNRWIRFKEWLKARFNFCDVYFGLSKYEVNTLASTEAFTVKFSMPQYFNTFYDDSGVEVPTETNWGTECIINNIAHDNIEEGSVQKLWYHFSPEYIIDDGGLFRDGGEGTEGRYITGVNPRIKMNNLRTFEGNWITLTNIIDLSENTYMDTMIVNNVVSTTSGAIPKSVVNLTIADSFLIPTLSEYTNLRNITFNNCSGVITLIDCPNLESITFTSETETSAISLIMRRCGSQDKVINFDTGNVTFGSLVFDTCYIDTLSFPLGSNIGSISFTGNAALEQICHIKTLNLINCTIESQELDITYLDVQNLLLCGCSRLSIIDNSDFGKDIKYLGLYNSKVFEWRRKSSVNDITDADTFDGSLISSLNTVKMFELDYVTDTSGQSAQKRIDDAITALNLGTFSSTVKFRLRDCTLIRKVKNLNVTTTSTGLFLRCYALEEISNSIISAPAYQMFLHCYNLTTLPTNTLNNTSTITFNTDDSVNQTYRYSGYATFMSCLRLTYAQIEKVLDNNLVNGACVLTKYHSFLANKSYPETSTVTIDLSKYANAIEMEYAFTSRNWGGSDWPVVNKGSEIRTLRFTGTVPPNVTTLTHAFSSDGYHIYVIDNPTNFFDNCNALANLYLTFWGNKYTDSAKNTAFVAPKLPENRTDLNVSGVFASCNVDIKNLKSQDGYMYLPSNVVDGSAIFYYSKLMDSTEGLEENKIEVSLFFNNCQNITTATNCFRGAENIQCTDKLQFPNLSDGVAVNIAGIFADVSGTSKDNKIVFGVNARNDAWYSDTLSTNYKYIEYLGSMSNRYKVGPYYNVYVDIENNHIDITLTNNALTHIKRKLLQGAIIDNSTENSAIIEIDISVDNCEGICNDFVVSLESTTSCLVITGLNAIYANLAFSYSALNNYRFNLRWLDKNNVDVRIELPASLRSAEEMFNGSKITKIPKNINKCSNLQGIKGMFQNCTSMDDTISDAMLASDLTNQAIDYFLPISVTDITYLFCDCYRLHGGVPENFIQYIEDNGTYTRSNISTLFNLFRGTAVLLSNTAFSNITNVGSYAINISVMFPKVTTVNGMFYNVNSRTYNLYVQPISSACFKNCINCDGLFANSKVILPTLVDFSAATTMQFAFATAFNVGTTRNLSNLGYTLKRGARKNINGIFASINSSTPGTLEVTDIAHSLLLMIVDSGNIIVKNYDGMLCGYMNSSSITQDDTTTYAKAFTFVQSSSYPALTSEHA